MTEAKHTPGPWFYGDWLKNNPGAQDDSGWVEVWNIDADGYKGLPFVACKHHDEIANARLISAAPDLLEALLAAKNTLVAFKFQPGDANCWEPHDEENLALVDASIAKATGN